MSVFAIILGAIALLFVAKELIAWAFLGAIWVMLLLDSAIRGVGKILHLK